MPNDTTAPQTRIDILGLGVSTIDDLLVLESMPRPNHKQQVLSKTRQCGGLTGSALVAAARLGCRTGFLIALGQGELSAFTRKHFAEEGVALFETGSHPETEPYQSTILTEAGTGERSILWDNSRCSPPAAGEREVGLAVTAGCLFVDHVYAQAILPLVRAARAAGVPVVGDFERMSPGSDEVMALTDHIILPLSFAHENFGGGSVEALVTRLARVSGRQVAAVTDGIAGAWWAESTDPEKVNHQPVFAMPKIVDTTGCGDVFHGVYAAGLVKGWSPAERIRRAAAAAALKTQKLGAQAGAPTLEELEEFLMQRS